MITQQNLKEVLEILGFEALSAGVGESKKLNSKHTNIYTKTINSYIMQVDFAKQKLIYPQGIKINDTTTSNFSHPENFVVFECVHRLLEKGYKAESLELEPKWQLGREAKSGKADILVRDNKNAPYLIIECKTAGETSKSEFSKEWERMQNNGGQLFSYFQQEKATKFLCLYTSDLEAESKSIKYQNYIIQAFDNDEYLQENGLEKSYKKASNNTELFTVWKESYERQSFTQGIFENDVNAYKILELTPTFSNLQELKEKDKHHEFAKILRKHNISGKENAFDKLVNIFLCKIYDESFNKNNLKFGYFGVMADSYASMQDRLMLLYKEAMSEFLGEEITFVSNDDIEKAFKKLHATDLKAQIQKHIKELKFYSNNDFAFLEVHNKELFLQNALVLKEIIELFAPYKLTQNSTNQFLGNLFELFLQKGMKQDEGQFFTPIQICEFIMYALPLDSMLSSKPLKVLDFACGAGHFLNTYANELKRYATQDLQEHYKQIYGIEKEYRLSKVAKVSSAMYGQNEINILYADALATHELENPKTDSGNKQKPQINNHSFDLLIANPPYSVKGFLETLSAKSKKTYTLFTNEINIETNNAIECFFIERANQLLRDNAKAAIILPSSILNKDGIYKSTREILLINFDFIAIVELGSGTFGATGTNTIILFLRKKENFTPENATISQDYSNIKNYIESGHLSQNEPYKDYTNAFNAYCDFRGFDKGEYESFLNGSLESYPFGWVQGVGVQNSKNAKSTTQLLELDTFKEYHAAFKETSEYKKLLDSKAYKDSKDKDTLAYNAFLAYARAIEKDKLLYFSLALNQAPIIIKAPSDNKEQKKFLGYEWSNRKGDEGLKELHSPYLSPLFERDNPHNPNKLAYLIRQAFVSTDMGEVRGLGREKASQIESNPIPQDLSPYAFKAKLIDMLDFSKVDFNKAISLNPTNSQGEGKTQNPFENSKFELVKIGEIILENPKSKIQVREAKENTTGIYPFYTSGTNIYRYDESLISGENIYLSTGGNAIVQFYNGESAYSTDTYVIKANAKMLTKFLFYILQMQQNYINTFLFKGTGLKHLQKQDFKNLKIPLPPLEIQKQIVAECEKIEEQYNTIRMSIEKYQELIRAILVKCGIIANTDESIGGATSRLIASLLDSIQELESKLDFDNNNTLDFKTLLASLPTPPAQGWDTKKLQEIANISRGASPRPINEFLTQDSNGVNWIKIGDVADNAKYITQTKEKITPQGAEKSKFVKVGDFILSNSMSIGRPYILKIDGCIHDGWLLLSNIDRTISKEFLYYALISSDTQKQFKEKASGMVVENLKIDLVKSVKIPLPPLEAQEKIVSAIERIELTINVAKERKETFQSKISSYIQNALC
ncbi:restriction endonuclease subunit S [Campylobacter felis]|uniref:restriction endonuclease subunit S n=1 Tax=Campylobacter felis TaxID=2974565 RepID=UPI0025650BB2|nr:restriction endonuclease subunit S [Campylobacter felis]MDL0109930.1 restriction endonuclease subunit S [Campylobacter felis]